MKCLNGMTPKVAISVVISLHSWSVSGKYFAQVSGILELLEVDEVMADRGFCDWNVIL